MLEKKYKNIKKSRNNIDERYVLKNGILYIIKNNILHRHDVCININLADVFLLFNRKVKRIWHVFIRYAKKEYHLN